MRRAAREVDIAEPGGTAWGGPPGPAQVGPVVRPVTPGRPRGCRVGVLAGLALALAATAAGAAPLGETGRQAYDTARSVDDSAAAALEEGEKTAAQLKALVPERETVPPVLKPYLEQGEAAHQALVGYRRLAQASSTEALRLLADVSKLPVVPAPDLVRRDTLEQHALLAAHEAARNERVRPMYEFTSQLAALEPPPPEMRALFGALRGNADATNAFLSAITGAIPLAEFMSNENLGRIMAAAKDVETHR